MNEELKKGDRVECIDDDNGTSELKRRGIYTITKIDSNYVSINEEEPGWSKSRFKKVDGGEQMSKFKVGDEIVGISTSKYCITCKGNGYGIVKLVPDKKHDMDNDIQIKWYPSSEHGGSGRHWVDSKYFELRGGKSMNKFDKNDRVKCINDVGASELIEGNFYTVTENRKEDLIEVNGDSYEWDISRFVKVDGGKTKMSKFEVGDEVRRTNNEYGDLATGTEYVVSEVSGSEIRVEGRDSWYSCNNFELISKGGKKMKIENMNKDNVKEALKQANEDKNNAEISEAKSQHQYATNEIDRLDREIRIREDDKKPHLETLKKFSTK